MHWQKIVVVVGLVIIAWFGYGLTRDPNRLSSALIDKDFPAFELPLLGETKQSLTEQDLKGQVTIVNVWASWCIPCRAEHRYITRLAVKEHIPVVGINYKDERSAAKGWLKSLGNPYAAVVADPEGALGFDLGVSAVPETFVVDAEGIIRYKEPGPINSDILQNTILPLVRRLQETS